MIMRVQSARYPINTVPSCLKKEMKVFFLMWVLGIETVGSPNKNDTRVYATLLNVLKVVARPVIYT